MSSWELYWILRLDNIRDAIFVVAVATGVFCAIMGLFLVVARVDEKVDSSILASTRKAFISVLIAFVFSLAALALTPTTKGMLLIKVVPPLVNSEVAKRIPDDMTELYDLAVKELKARAKSEVEK